ncbi:MAG: dCMP deaminase [Fusobacteriaceae bacterium]|jgi:dCMP deaminase|nr:CMP/dCMP deaminase zinc-binding protein [Fusobacteriales bacterium]MDN5303362.1 dCMP deaminase [Fusobacteriaceae bacterium]
MGKFNDDLMFMLQTEILAKQSHCQRLQVAAMIVKEGRILSIGYNGTPKGLDNCDDIFTNDDKLKEDFSKEHHIWSDIHELHAEQNAISWAARQGIAIKDATIYVKYSPCRHCTKMIIASGIKRVVFLNRYDRDQEGLKIMERADIEIVELDNELYNNFKSTIIDSIK